MRKVNAVRREEINKALSRAGGGGLTVRAIGKRTGIHYSYVHKILKGMVIDGEVDRVQVSIPGSDVAIVVYYTNIIDESEANITAQESIESGEWE